MFPSTKHFTQIFNLNIHTLNFYMGKRIVCKNFECHVGAVSAHRDHIVAIHKGIREGYN